MVLAWHDIIFKEWNEIQQKKKNVETATNGEGRKQTFPISPL